MKKCLVGPETKRVLEQGHPWVIADRYTRQWPKLTSGALVSLVDEQQRQLATALCDPGDRVVARVLPGHPEKITREWLEDRLYRCRQLRRHLLLEDTNCYRLVNAEGDGLPGITVDQYADYLILQLYTPAWEPYLPLIVDALAVVYQPVGVYLKYRPQQTRKLEAQNKSQQTNRLLRGTAAPVPLQVSENGLCFLINLHSGLHTGLFFDQRNNRREVMRRVSGLRVLNLFAFTGAFSVAAAVAGAQQVTSIDVSEKYLKIAHDNFVCNQLLPQQHRFICGDVFVELSRLSASHQQYDCILFDPPSFSTTKKSRFSTQGGTSDLVAAVLPLLSPGGLMISASNHQKISMDDYLKEIRRGALTAGATLQTIHTAGQPEDFPCDPSFPEGRYLKFVINVKEF